MGVFFSFTLPSKCNPKQSALSLGAVEHHRMTQNPLQRTKKNKYKQIIAKGKRFNTHNLFANLFFLLLDLLGLTANISGGIINLRNSKSVFLSQLAVMTYILLLKGMLPSNVIDVNMVRQKTSNIKHA